MSYEQIKFLSIRINTYLCIEQIRNGFRLKRSFIILIIVVGEVDPQSRTTSVCDESKLILSKMKEAEEWFGRTV